eukprot:8530111-Pyramimonas_sp.AAC.1
MLLQRACRSPLGASPGISLGLLSGHSRNLLGVPIVAFTSAAGSIHPGEFLAWLSIAGLFCFPFPCLDQLCCPVL